MIKKFVAAIGLALLASSSFAAAPVAFYGGLDVGSTKIDEFDSSETSFGGFVGYGFNRFVAIEVGYRQLGKYNLFGGDVTLRQTHVSVIGSYPLSDRFDLYARAGHNSIDMDTNNPYVSGSGDGALYGIGLNYNFTPQLSGRVEVQSPARDSSTVNVGVVWKF